MIFRARKANREVNSLLSEAFDIPNKAFEKFEF